MQDHAIRCLHGFLGLASDWNSFPGFFGEDLYSSVQPFQDWVSTFHNNIKNKEVLLGYSMGGRLALHALVAHPEKWHGGIIISAHPGISSSDLRKERYASDLKWADRFEKESWKTLLHDWNRQAIFTNQLLRLEKDFDRKQLSAAMRIWSLGLQQDLSAAIKNLDIPILWIAGEKDLKFCQAALKTRHKNSKIWIASGAGHRVPWDNPEEFYQQVQHFYMKILSEQDCCEIHSMKLL